MGLADRYCLGCLTRRDFRKGSCLCGGRLGPDKVRTEPAALRPATVLAGKYLVGRLLGRGGFGITYLGVDTDLDLRVAVKEYFPCQLAARDPATQKVVALPGAHAAIFGMGLPRFLEEGRVLARFGEHPNIVQIMNFFEGNGTGYLVMRFLEGKTAEGERADAGGRLAEAAAVRVIAGALSGLEAVHAEGVMHRDLKPSNMFVPVQGEPRLLDFGAARYFVHCSRPYSLVWTPGFAAPEQIAGLPDQGPWTDVYAAGASLYHLLTGRPPPPADERVKDRHEVPLTPPHEATRGAVSRAVSDAVMRALRLDSGARFRSARAMAEALARPPVPPPKEPPVERRPGPTLRCLRGEFESCEFPLEEHDLSIGRDPDRCGLVFQADTPGVARCHLVVRVAPETGKVFVMDPGSTHGTWLDGKEIARKRWYEVHPGQRIALGSEDVVFDWFEVVSP